MENTENPSVMELTVKAGEIVILKGEDGATISEVKKPKRNTAKERKWEKEKYHRFTFLVDKQQAQKFIDLLDEKRPDLEDKKRPLLWFREKITNFTDDTLNVDNNNTLNEINDLKNRLEVTLKMNAIENNQELATLKAEMSKAFKLDYEDFQNSKDKEHSQELCDIYRVIISRFFKGLEKFGITYNTLNVYNNTLNVDSRNDEQISFPDEMPNKNTLNVNSNTFNVINENDEQISFPDEKPKRTRKPPPNADERNQWVTEYNNGLPAKRIAEIFERDVRAVSKHLKATGLLEE